MNLQYIFTAHKFIDGLIEKLKLFAGKLYSNERPPFVEPGPKSEESSGQHTAGIIVYRLPGHFLIARIATILVTSSRGLFKTIYTKLTLCVDVYERFHADFRQVSENSTGFRDAHKFFQCLL